MNPGNGFSPEIQAKYRVMRWRVFTSTWLSYAGFYLTRKALSVAMIGIQDDPELAFSNTRLGIIPGAYLTAYMFGQFVNGPLADRFGPRKIVLAGMIVSIVACFLTGFSTALAGFVAFLIIQGVSQSTGWPSLVKNMTSWFSQRERGGVMGWWCTNYAIGGLVATPFAAVMVTTFNDDWRYAFFIPPVALALVVVYFVWAQRNRPEDVGLPSIEEFHGEEESVLVAGERPEEEPEGSWKVVRQVLTNRTILILGVAYFCLKPVRYAILFWGPKIINENMGTGVLDSALVSAAFELGGPLGILGAGYASDVIFKSKRMPICIILLPLSGLILLYLGNIDSLSISAVAVALFFLGFAAFGPDSIISGTAAMDFGTKKGAATAAGFINGMGSIGAVLGGSLPGYISDRWGWETLFYVLAGLVFLAAILMLPMWNRIPPSAAESSA